ncbi:protein MTSS 2-like isoform X4 [Petromyzon marinus]|uniref:protein MTSS 2-like isoform X4 n=1 Tax=Petromyzon marinus TaxID=7757 RepID=UPI003F725B1F
METALERECNALGGLFQSIVNDMKSSYPVWEDFTNKATKFHSQLRTTVVAAATFLDAFQKIADLATNSRGATREIGSAFTRMCMRHKSIEFKLRQFSVALLDSLINPLQERLEDWKKSTNQLDKDHAKDFKRVRQEIKKKSLDTMKLQKKVKKGKGEIQPQLEHALQDVTDMYLLLEETEKQAVRRALIEERTRFCSFACMLRPVVDEELAMLEEITHLQTIVDDLAKLTVDPHRLPPASEQVILDLKGSDYSWSYQTPPSSPSSSGSRKSSMCSSNSIHSSDSQSSGSHPYSAVSHYRYHGLHAHTPALPSTRLSSISSHDSGFMSQDVAYSKPPSPLPLDAVSQVSQKSLGSASSEASEPGLSVSSCGSPAPAVVSSSTGPHADKDWSKPGPYDQPMVNTLQRRRDKSKAKCGDAEKGADGDAAACQPDEGQQRPRSIDVPTGIKVGEVSASELALVLKRGLHLESQKSNRDSMQGSSGYSTQTTTPSCSEDTLPSQVSDSDCLSVNGDAELEPAVEFDRSCTIPRNSDLSQSYRRMFHSKRPASTAGIPNCGGAATAGTPGVATIRRNPSSKPLLRRAGSAAGPIPIRPPVVPVKPPAVPTLPGSLSPSHAGSDESLQLSGGSASPSSGSSGGGGCGGGASEPTRASHGQRPGSPGRDGSPLAPEHRRGSPGHCDGAQEHKRGASPVIGSVGSSTASDCGDPSIASSPSKSDGAFSVQSSAPGSPTSPVPAAETPRRIAARERDAVKDELCGAENQQALVVDSGAQVSRHHGISPAEPSCPLGVKTIPVSPCPSPPSPSQGEDVLSSIRRGVRLRRTITNDRSAPRI